MNYIDWQQAVDFCMWAGGRLPSEAEWEYAARSGGQHIIYPWGDEDATCAYAVMYEGGHGCGTDRTMVVCSKTDGNTLQGLCDIAGNVNEWVRDTWHDTYDGAPGDGSAWEDGGTDRVARGGSLFNYLGDVRAAKRGYAPPDSGWANVGARCVRDAP